MGLDMYYFKTKKRDGIHAVATDQCEVLGNLRKHNQVFGWLKANSLITGDGAEVVQMMQEDLTKLIDQAHRVLDHPELAETEMPRVDGFFFGDTEYGDYYFQELRDTIKFTEEAAAKTNWDEENLYLLAWW